MRKPSVKLKSLEKTAINTKTFDEYKEVLRVFNCGGWMVRDDGKEINPPREYFWFTNRMERLKDLDVNESDICIEACPLYEDYLFSIEPRHTHKKDLGNKIISPFEFYRLQENLPLNQIKAINNYFEEKEKKEVSELNENYKLKSSLILKLDPLPKTAICPKTEKEYKEILRIFYLGGWMDLKGNYLEPDFYYNKYHDPFIYTKGKICVGADGHICKGNDLHIKSSLEYSNFLKFTIISLKEFYKKQNINPDLKKINDFFETHEKYRAEGWIPKKEKLRINSNMNGICEMAIDNNPGERVICSEIKKIREAVLTSPVARKRFYATENGEEVDLSKLNPGWVQDEEFKTGHKNFVFGCQDIMLEYDGGLLLVVRDNVPAKDVLWPIGGNYKKGVPPMQALKKKVKAECGLEIEGEPICFGDARTAFQTDPWGHGKGTDTTNERYFAKAKGKLKLDDLHKEPTIVKPENYTPEFRAGLEKYVRDFMDLSMLFVDGMNPIRLYNYLHESLLHPQEQISAV